MDVNLDVNFQEPTLLATPRSSFAATEERMLPPTEESALEAQVVCVRRTRRRWRLFIHEYYVELKKY